MDKYVKIAKVGEGAHGVVYKARLIKPLNNQPLSAQLSVAAQLQHDKAEAVDDEHKAADLSSPFSSAPSSSSPFPSSVIPHTPDRSHLKRKHSDGGGDDGRTPSSQLASTFASQSLSSPSPLSSVSSYNFSASSHPTAPAPVSLPLSSVVAIKKIRLRSVGEGLSMEAVREVKILQELHHPCVVRVLDVFQHNANLNVVLDFMDSDLESLIKHTATRIREADAKRFVWEILRGVAYCHRRWVLHRDLKPGNVLLARGAVRLTDFGLAKLYGSPERRLSPQACTMWYRAPELLFGCTAYGPPMDVWSVGCIMAELHWRRPLFAGPESEIAQLQRIFAVLGTPAQAGWEDVDALPEYIRFEAAGDVRPLRDAFPRMEKDGVDLLACMLQLDPRKRITAKDALSHPWFTRGAPMTPIDNLPALPTSHADHS